VAGAGSDAHGLPKSSEVSYRAAMAAFDPIAFMPHANPGALYFQFAADDPFVPNDVAASLYAAASEPKLIGWYGGGHDLDEMARIDRDAWLAVELGLTALR
jgi:hypothetical protein